MLDAYFSRGVGWHKSLVAGSFNNRYEWRSCILVTFGFFPWQCDPFGVRFKGSKFFPLEVGSSLEVTWTGVAYLLPLIVYSLTLSF